jgi:hypothetical protein
MENSNLSNAQVLKFVLEPLLEDFQYWFDRYEQILENEKIKFMSDNEQFDLMQRVKTAKNQLITAKMLFAATDQQVGIDMATVTAWHQLVTECWRVGMRLGLSKE